MSDEIDLGHDHTGSFTGWFPDRVLFDLPGVAELFEHAVWQVESWEPLTISPSVLCRRCGDHGFIREGRWVPA